MGYQQNVGISKVWKIIARLGICNSIIILRWRATKLQVGVLSGLCNFVGFRAEEGHCFDLKRIATRDED